MRTKTTGATLVVISSIAARVARAINGDTISNDSETNPYDLERRIAQRVYNKKDVEGASNAIK